MTPQIGCDRRNSTGRLTLSSALRQSSSTTFVASSSFFDQTSSSNGRDHAGFRMPSRKYLAEVKHLKRNLPVESVFSVNSSDSALGESVVAG